MFSIALATPIARAASGDDHDSRASRPSQVSTPVSVLVHNNSTIRPALGCGPGSDYTVVSSTNASLVPASSDIGNYCDDCTTPITLPFTYSLYGQSFTNAEVGSNGVLGFLTNTNAYRNYALPAIDYNYTIFPHWDDLRTDAQTGCSSYPGGCGIFTSVAGSPPNQRLYIEWRAVLRVTNTAVNFEVVLYEGQNRFEVRYGNIANQGSSATSGVQSAPATLSTQYSFNTNNSLFPGLQLAFFEPPCTTNTPVPTITPTHTIIPTNTLVPTFTSTRTFTNTPASTTGTPLPAPTDTRSATRTPLRTPTPCTLGRYSDVHPEDYYYVAAYELAIAGVMNGYSDCTFRPGNSITRGQTAKIVVLGAGRPANCPIPGHFSDVPPSDPFFCYIETAYNATIISGYADGTFRPGNDVTRGQFSKMVQKAFDLPIDTHGGPHFSDVPPGSTFFDYIETLFNNGLISGYSDGTFRPGNSLTRGQGAKITYQARVLVPSPTPTVVTMTPTPTPTCGPTFVYSFEQSPGGVINRTDKTLVPDRCKDCILHVDLPPGFDYSLYGVHHTNLYASTNGYLDSRNDPPPTDAIRPECVDTGSPDLGYSIFGYWDEQLSILCNNCGIYTATTGIAPSRTFFVEWRGCLRPYGGSCANEDTNFEIRLYEGTNRFDVIYAAAPGAARDAVIGVHGANTQYTRYACNTGFINNATLPLTVSYNNPCP
jgi:hypothetical protein